MTAKANKQQEQTCKQKPAITAITIDKKEGKKIGKKWVSYGFFA